MGPMPDQPMKKKMAIGKNFDPSASWGRKNVMK
jgi:hypothetical protein